MSTRIQASSPLPVKMPQHTMTSMKVTSYTRDITINAHMSVTNPNGPVRRFKLISPKLNPCSGKPLFSRRKHSTTANRHNLSNRRPRAWELLNRGTRMVLRSRGYTDRRSRGIKWKYSHRRMDICRGSNRSDC